MNKIVPYLIILNHCTEAIELYVKAFSAEIKIKQKYSETEYEVSQNYKNSIAHAEIICNEFH